MLTASSKNKFISPQADSLNTTKIYCQVQWADSKVNIYLVSQTDEKTATSSLCRAQDTRLPNYDILSLFTSSQHYFCFVSRCILIKILFELMSELFNKGQRKQSDKFVIEKKNNRLSKPDKRGQNDHQNYSFKQFAFKVGYFSRKIRLGYYDKQPCMSELWVSKLFNYTGLY